MADTFAHVTIVGNVVRDPELRTTRNGKSFTRVTIAANRNWQDQDGSWQKETTYRTVELWGKSAEDAVAKIRKGMCVSASGDESMSSYVGRDGTTRYSLDVRGCQRIHVVERRERSEQAAGESEPSPVGDEPTITDIDVDELPF